MNNTEVLLINPLDKGHVTNGLGLKVPPLNLMYLAAALEKASMSVKIFDDDLYQVGFDKMANLASKIDPMVVGVTATTATIKNALKYVEAVKKLLPNVLTVIGGPHPTFSVYNSSLGSIVTPIFIINYISFFIIYSLFFLKLSRTS